MSSKVVVKSLAELGALLDMESKPTTRDAEVEGVIINHPISKTKWV